MSQTRRTITHAQNWPGNEVVKADDSFLHILRVIIVWLIDLAVKVVRKFSVPRHIQWCRDCVSALPFRLLPLQAGLQLSMPNISFTGTVLYLYRNTWYDHSFESSRRDDSNEWSHHMVLQSYKNNNYLNTLIIYFSACRVLIPVQTFVVGLHGNGPRVSVFTFRQR